VLEQRLRAVRLEVAVGAHERLLRLLLARALRLRLAEKLEQDVRLPDVKTEHLKTAAYFNVVLITGLPDAIFAYK
jgi:hypothetical protein